MRYLFLRRRWPHRFDRETFRARLHQHVSRWGIVYVAALFAAAWFHANCAIALNASPSLPHRVFLIHKGAPPQRDAYVAFRWHGGGPYATGTTFVKVIAGMPGDVVTMQDRAFHVNGTPVGIAKTLSQQGEPLDPGPVGILPAGRYYVRAPHPDSLDSRYRLTGWIAETQIIGRAYALF
jgi:conjugal transfer pilin signal peptidase TrbI